MKVIDYLKLMRIKHYIKNILIFVPMVFSMSAFDMNILNKVVCGFISFCFISSAVYVINDIKDVDKDRKHIKKKTRPIASGKVSIKEALALMFILFVISILINVFIINDFYCVFIILLYFLLNVGYSFGLKNIPILDVVILVSGFILRVLYGSLAINVELSNWLYLTVMSASFFLGFGKRRNEIIKQGKNSRDVLKYYTKDFLDKFMYVCLVLTIIFYSLWAIDPNSISRFGNDFFIYTVPLVLVIFMKYCLNIEGNSLGDPVDVLTSDKVLTLLVFVYIISSMCIIYLF